MKSIRKALILTLLVPMFFACKKDSSTRFITCSDTHYLAKSLIDPNRDYDKENFATDGRSFNYNATINDNLLIPIKNHKL